MVASITGVQSPFNFLLNQVFIIYGYYYSNVIMPTCRGLSIGWGIYATGYYATFRNSTLLLSSGDLFSQYWKVSLILYLLLVMIFGGRSGPFSIFQDSNSPRLDPCSYVLKAITKEFWNCGRKNFDLAVPGRDCRKKAAT
jgi:hypothetical protein